MLVEGQAAIVSGGASGLGRAAAKALAEAGVRSRSSMSIKRLQWRPRARWAASQSKPM
jgi:NAD(P)-dependent dehydrogenase (short-subunit alcohol dehydrogenase family)